MWNCYFSSNCDAFIFLEIDFAERYPCRRISWFRRWIQPKEANKSQIPKFDISYSISNFNAFFWQNYHLYGLLMNHNRCNFHNSTISHIWKKYLTLEMLSKIQWVWGFFLCTTHWCVKQFTVKSKILCPHLFLIYTCSTFPYRYADVASCFALFSFLLFLSRVLSNEWK
jgi:hypothetical protein